MGSCLRWILALTLLLVPLLSYFVKEKHAASWRVMKRFIDTPLIIGHNTNCEESIRRAVELYNINAIEVDLRKTKDSKLVTIHDSTIKAKFNGAKGRVIDFTAAQLTSMDAKCDTVEGSINSHVLQLEDVIELVDELNLLLVAELKGNDIGHVDIICDVFAKQRETLFDSLMVFSFYENILSSVRRRCPDVATGLFIDAQIVDIGCEGDYIRSKFLCLYPIRKAVQAMYFFLTTNFQWYRSYIGVSGISARVENYNDNTIDTLRAVPGLFVGAWNVTDKLTAKELLQRGVSVTAANEGGVITGT